MSSFIAERRPIIWRAGTDAGYWRKSSAVAMEILQAARPDYEVTPSGSLLIIEGLAKYAALDAPIVKLPVLR